MNTKRRRPIEMSLANLTQEHIDKAMPNVGSCTYSSPCILGAMMPPGLIRRLKAEKHDYTYAYDGQSINQLAEDGFVKFTGGENELKKARRIQEAFDSLGDSTHNARTRQNALRTIRRALPGLKVSMSKVK